MTSEMASTARGSSLPTRKKIIIPNAELTDRTRRLSHQSEIYLNQSLQIDETTVEIRNEPSRVTNLTAASL